MGSRLWGSDIFMGNWHEVDVAEFPVRHCRGKGEDPRCNLVVRQGERKLNGKKASVEDLSHFIHKGRKRHSLKK